MNPADIERYIALVAKAYELQDRLRKNPPNDPAEILAAITEITMLWSEISQLANSGDLDPADIVAAHARNQRTWGDGSSTGGGGDHEEIYGIAFPLPIPSNDELFARGFVSTDLVYEDAAASMYLVMRRGDMQPAGYHLSRRLDGK